MTDVTARVQALESALATGEPWLAADLVDQARSTVARSLQRMELGTDHTVVALVGATGSGKSSLFNALARMEIAQVGARRPMTSLPMACVWGEGGSEQLLDWLGVPADRRITRESVLDADLQAPLQGLVLLDLPDHDSTEVIHRVEVDRLVTMVDLLIWVVDPQKYADDALHSGYLQRLVGHDDVMVVVLNQIDRLDADEAATCTRDLRRLLDGDGLGAVRMLPVSARRGDGVDDLRALLAEVVQDRSAGAERVSADLDLAIAALGTGLAEREPGDAGEPPGTDLLIAELGAAAGVPALLDAVAGEYCRRGRIKTEWFFLRRFTPARHARTGGAVDVGDLRLIDSDRWPASATSQRPRVELAVEAAVAAAAGPLPRRWADSVRDGVRRPGGDDLVDELDRGLAGVDLRISTSSWWGPVAVLQHVLTAASAATVVWLVLLGVTAAVGDGLPTVPVLGVPLALVILVGGLLASILVAVASAWALSVGARRRRQAAQVRLEAVVHAIASARVIAPIREVLSQHRATRLALAGRVVHIPGAEQPVAVSDVIPVAAVGVSDDVTVTLPDHDPRVVGVDGLGRPVGGPVVVDGSEADPRSLTV